MAEWHGTYRLARMTAERSTSNRQLGPLRTMSWLFDDLIRVPGTRFRFGLDALLGLLPGGGDVLGGAISAYALVVAGRLGAPASVIVRMAINIILDATLGAIPLLGDLFDAGWKANRRNVELLERYLDAPAAARRSSVTVVAVTIAALLLILVAIAAGTVWLIGALLSLL